MGMRKVQLNCKAADQRTILSVYRYLLYMLGRCACALSVSVCVNPESYRRDSE